MAPVRGWLLAGLAMLAVGMVPRPVAAQPPLQAALSFNNPPANLTYDQSTPVSLILQLSNVSRATVFTPQGFSTTDFWRRLVFVDPLGGIIINTTEDAIHVHPAVFFCLSRRGVLQVPTAIPVEPREELPGTFFLQYTIQDARTFFDLSRAGRYSVSAHIPLLTLTPTDPNAVINDCDQFPGQTMVNVGGGLPSSHSFTVVSNTLEFTIAGDSIPPTTTVTETPTPNSFGWNNQDMTLTFTATDNEPGGSGVKQIVVTTTGAQTGQTVFNGASGSLVVSTEGTTNVTFAAVDHAGNKESPHSLLVQLDKTPPQVACSASPASLWPPNHKMVPVTVSVAVTDALSGPAGFVLTSATSNEPGRNEIQSFVVGKAATSGSLEAARAGRGTGRVYSLVYIGTDVAGNTAACTATVRVPHDQGQ